jgi:nicotinamide-nucleotide amidase
MTGRAMTAELITIGDELLIGQVVNTNQAFIAERVNGLGIRIARMTTVGDDLDAIVASFADGMARADVVLVTGGLGPTHDDITRTAVCRLLDTDLVVNEDVRRHIESLLAIRNLSWSHAMDDQIRVPRAATVLPNPAGTAPGLWCERNGRVLVVMPGVPYEMKAIMEGSVLPRLAERHAGRVIIQRTLRTTGIPESMLAQQIGDLDEVLETARLAFLPSPRGVRLRISVEASERGTAEALVARVEGRIRARAGKYIYGTGDQELEEVVGRMLADRGLTLSVAESCTGGEIASRITDVSGSSAYFERGVVAYSNRSKVEVLGVPEGLISRAGAVSKEVAEAMARGILERSASSFALSTTGIAGPTGGTPGKPVGLVWIGIADRRDVLAVKFTFGGSRSLIKERASQAALELLRRRLLGLDGGG